ncbi:hypothetical protein FOMPIDRAFT_1055021 [Fomitopsis schrenkii]|uniref:DNA 3'-5' helicase n=1 Tax=Fomitopsis schrenkii TaxID=2126942 RepID=S8F6H9_FOMSC|nr:hypothetical protein FOMPIDRAFT_1055021 [Fomitopsis schrenkii]
MSRWPIERIRQLVLAKFKKRACLFQIRIAQALREKKKDVVAIAATGSGKTLSFWIPLLMALEDGEDKMIIVVTPLNILGKQNVTLLAAAGISGIAIDGRNATDKTFTEVEKGKHQVVVINPEVLMKEGGHCEQLWKKPSFTSRLLYIVFDEGHCISEWNSFREKYKYVGSLRYMIPETVPFYVASATLPHPVLCDVTDILHLRKQDTEFIFRSNDRPDIALAVHQMQHPASSYEDLSFLIPDGFGVQDNPPPKFLVFCNSVPETQAVIAYLRQRLPESLRLKVKWFHAHMTAEYRNEEFIALRDGDIYGLVVTDAFGMGLDLTGIQLIVQWKAPASINTLWQRFGRAARGEGEFAFAILIAEKEHFDEEKERKLAAKAKRLESRKRKRGKQSKNAPNKQRAIHDTAAASGQPGELPTPSRVPAEYGTGDAVSSDNEDVDENPEGDTEIQEHEQGRGEADVEEEAVAEAAEVAAVAAEANERRREVYNQRIKVESTKSKQERILQPAVLDLINAASRGLGCRRQSITLVYSNDKRASDHMECDKLSPHGCARCSPKPMPVCCDLCHPAAFEALRVSARNTAKQTRKSNIKVYDPGAAERDLRAALFTWRDSEMKKLFTVQGFSDYGGKLFMPSPILKRIVDCAHGGKLWTLSDFKKEIPWRLDWIEQYGEIILDLVRYHFPAPPPPPSPPPPPPPPVPQAQPPTEIPAHSTGTPPRPEPPDHTAPGPRAQAKKRRPPTCSRCGELGHTTFVRDGKQIYKSTTQNCKSLPPYGTQTLAHM